MLAKNEAFRNYHRPNACRVKLSQLLQFADVAIGGDRPWDIQVHDDRFYARAFGDGFLGFGESYMDGWWDCERIDELVYRSLRAGIDKKFKPWKEFVAIIKAKLINLQSQLRAREIGRRHYDIDIDLYRRMLDKRMIYSCGYWKNAATLDEAQEAKLDLVCRKLDLEPGTRVLDIGCGWGGTARYVSERYQVEVVGITVSEEQVKTARETCRGLPIEIRLQDYRKIEGVFDRVYSLGMFEHVGYKNYKTYMRVVSEHLVDDGLFLLHTISGNESDTVGNLWAERHIFPNSMLPSAAQICTSIEARLVAEDWQNFGPDYDTTLMHWFGNFQDNMDYIKENYGERFYRTWKFYLLSFAGAFRARHNQLWQIVLSPKGAKARYDAPR